MTTHHRDTPGPEPLDTLADLGRDVVERPTAAELDQGLNSLYARIAAGKAHRRSLLRWSFVGVTMAVVVLVGLRLTVFSHGGAALPGASPLAYRIEGGKVLDGGYLREAGRVGIQLLFNEGSTIVLSPGTRGRLRSVDKEGARVAIEKGDASFQVTPSHDRRWFVEVGPFQVAVKGTVFTVAWDPGSEIFDLKLRHGSVVVSGPVPGGDVSLRAGQRLQVRLAQAEALISDEQGEASVVDSADGSVPSARALPAVRSVVGPDKPVGAAPVVPPTRAIVAKNEAGQRWAKELSNGDWDQILSDVERVGVSRTIETASSDDLFAVASAARYRHRADLSQSALLAVRRRFPASPRALDALFLLGRVEELRGGDPTRAIAWYDDYLSRVSHGDFAGEALGRKMILVSDLGGPEKARPIAVEYLRRFPQGSYAGSARALLATP